MQIDAGAGLRFFLKIFSESGVQHFDQSFYFQVVAYTEEDVTVEFLDWGDEETFDSQKVPSEILSRII